jgi:hypothetical protein
MDIKDKIEQLNPASQDMVHTFIDFLLWREAQETAFLKPVIEDSPFLPLSTHEQAQSQGQPPDAPIQSTCGIILAQEQTIEEESPIDFADINTRFSKKERDNRAGKTEAVWQQKPLDWL